MHSSAHPARAGAAASAIALTISAAAAAQQSREAEPATTQEVIVTGSRIQQTSGMTTPTPVTTVTAVEMATMAPGNMIDALGQLPQFFGSTTPSATGGFFTSPGAGNLNLRGMGTNRTLVLLDGRRVVSSTRLGGTDINVFPEAMIKSVETVTGGASAAYGTDAVAGVVNFILDTEFTGLEAHAQRGSTSRSDNDNWEASLAFGTEIGDRMHLLLSADSAVQDGVFSYDGRDWYDSWGTVTNPEWVATGMGPRELVRPKVVSTQATLGGVINAPGSAINRLHFLPDGTAVPFVLSDLAVVNTGTRSQSIANGGSGDFIGQDRPTLTPDSRRASGFLYFDVDATDNLNFYVQGIYGRSKTDQLNFGGLFQSPNEMRIFQDNAFLPESIRQVMIDENRPSFVFDRIGSTADTAAKSHLIQDNDTYSGTVGFKSEIGGDGFFAGWRPNGYYQYGTTRNRGYQNDGIRLDRVYAALDAVVDPGTGQIVCRSAMLFPDQYGDCVPLNYFGQGNASAAAVDWVTGFEPGQHVTSPLYFTDSAYSLGKTIDFVSGIGKVYRTDVTQHVFELSADGELSEGWGAGPIALAIGASYREEEIYQTVEDVTNPASDPTFRPVVGLPFVRGVPSGSSSRSSAVQNSTVPNINGSLDVKEAFVETIVPLLADKPFARQLNTTLAARWADYSGSGDIWAWKFGADWSINDAVRLRGTVSRDVRAGTLSERYDMTGGTTSFRDPVFNNAQLNATLRSGGNPDVAPEEADTVTIGAIFRPSFLEGFSMSADWYEIDIKGAIGQLGVQRIVDDCFAGAAALCQQITRDPTTNTIIQVNNVFLNINASHASGVDLEMSYGRQVSLFGGGTESVRARLFGTWLDEMSITNLGAAKLDRAGQTGGAFALPEYKLTASISYDNGPFSAFLQERWISSGINDATYREGVEIDTNRVSPVFYTDLRLSYSFETGKAGSWEVFGNAINLFDRDPPVTASFSTFAASAGQTNPSLYDLLGRRYYVGVRTRF